MMYGGSLSIQRRANNNVAACCCQMYPHMANLCLESSKPFKTYHAVRNALPRDFPSLSSTAHGMIQVHTFNFFPGVQGNNTSRVFKKHVPSPGSEHCLLPQVVATGKANQNSPTPGDPGNMAPLPILPIWSWHFRQPGSNLKASTARIAVRSLFCEQGMIIYNL